MAHKYSFFDNTSRYGNPYVKDYTHASNTFVRNNMRLAPKSKFLYHVVLNINPVALSSLGKSIVNILRKTEFNLLVESVDLPSYDIDVDTKNAYNRKKVVQTKINYQPVGMTFHDDNAGITTLLWEAYFRYYYQDPNYSRNSSTGFSPDTTTPPAYYDNTYYGEIYNKNRYGFDKTDRPLVDFFDTITVNQLHTQNGDSKFTSFTLVNPKIVSMQHDNLSYGDTGTTVNTMRIAYESVLYGRGITTRDNPAGFGDPQHYDVTPSMFSGNNNVGNDFNNKQPTLLDTFLAAFKDSFVDSFSSTLTDQLTFNSSQNLPYAIPTTSTSTTTNTIDNTLVSANQTFFLQNSRAEAYNTLISNTKALDDFAFRNVFYQEQLNNGFSGNLNDAKTAWNSLSTNARQQYRTDALNNFDSIRRANQ